MNTFCFICSANGYEEQNTIEYRKTFYDFLFDNIFSILSFIIFVFALIYFWNDLVFKNNKPTEKESENKNDLNSNKELHKFEFELGDRETSFHNFTDSSFGINGHEERFFFIQFPSEIKNFEDFFRQKIIGGKNFLVEKTKYNPQGLQFSGNNPSFTIFLFDYKSDLEYIIQNFLKIQSKQKEQIFLMRAANSNVSFKDLSKTVLETNTVDILITSHKKTTKEGGDEVNMICYQYYWIKDVEPFSRFIKTHEEFVKLLLSSFFFADN